MTVAVAAEWYTAVLLLVTGVSHITAPRAWARFFLDLLARPWGGLAVGLLHFMPALALLLAHPAWTSAPGVIVTALAWSWTVKGAIYLVWPGLPARVAARHLEHPERFVWAGVVLIGLGGGVVAGRLLGGG